MVAARFTGSGAIVDFNCYAFRQLCPCSSMILPCCGIPSFVLDDDDKHANENPERWPYCTETNWMARKLRQAFGGNASRRSTVDARSFGLDQTASCF